MSTIKSQSEESQEIKKLKKEITKDRLISARFLITEVDQDHLTESQKTNISRIVDSLNIIIDSIKRGT